jgi:hypothetical protein
MKKLMIKVQLKTWDIVGRVKNVVKSNKGEGFIDTAVKILISVVIGALLLSGLYMLFQDTILPTLTDRIKDMFDYQG